MYAGESLCIELVEKIEEAGGCRGRATIFRKPQFQPWKGVSISSAGQRDDGHVGIDARGQWAGKEIQGRFWGVMPAQHARGRKSPRGIRSGFRGAGDWSLEHL